MRAPARAALLFLAIVSPGRAESGGQAPPKLCRPLAALLGEIEDCELNDRFLEAGERCLDALDAEVRSVAGALPGSFSKSQDPRQTERFLAALGDHSRAAESLARLIDLGERAAGEVESYRMSLTYPPDHDEPDVNQGDEQGYLMSVSCYGQNRRNLDSLLRDFQRRLANLRSAKAAAGRLAKASDRRKQDLAAGFAGAAGTRSPAGLGQGAAASRHTTPRKRSTITGIHEDLAGRP